MGSLQIRQYVMEFGRQAEERDSSGGYVRKRGLMQIYLTNRVNTADVNSFKVGRECLKLVPRAIILVKKGQVGERDSGAIMLSDSFTLL